TTPAVPRSGSARLSNLKTERRIATAYTRAVLGVGGRISSGAQVAALPLAVALTAAAQSWASSLVVVMSGLAVLVSVLTFSPWAPGLNRLPAPLGAPKVKVTLRVIEPEQQNRVTSVFLEVGVKPTTRLEDAQVTFEFQRELFSYHAVRHLDAQGDPSGE